MSLKRIVLLAVSAFSMLSIYVIIQHERLPLVQNGEAGDVHVYLRKSKEQQGSGTSLVWEGFKKEVADKSIKYFKDFQNLTRILDKHALRPSRSPVFINSSQYQPPIVVTSSPKVETLPSVVTVATDPPVTRHGARRGSLTCKGQQIDSEVIYWKIVPGDNEYESPITPHHGVHHDRYLTYEYDEGGWNNIRMGMECHIVMAHAMGRTLVIPAQQHLYLLGRTHVDKHGNKRDEMGFEDFFDMDLLRGHKGFHVLSTKEFLLKEVGVGDWGMWQSGVVGPGRGRILR